ncbi:centrin-binding protein sfi1 [Ophiostoma piceae UAMH 11346]|uniref:Centrin-binding protein sfi1 n=1 Tax=Ophiostoma piceae (strain UAMH 11346) TaxID=1262450 RepID=S3CSV2_OPHP1|nr:centrin-binding protein sfi1 [Ophiostoma piceae UAMH 11346]
MPSHAPLSTRDGKIRSSSVQQVGEPAYYSNDDIELLHQVVTLGQEILPTLPKRDKLPTTALFRAADIVFPRYGLDPDGEDKLSRIIFMVGGMRSTDNLLDRFRTVLSRMGIELEYIQESSVDGDNNNYEPPSPARIKRRRRSSSRRSSSQHRRRNQHHPQHLQSQQPHTYASPASPHPPPSPSTHSTISSSIRERVAIASAPPVAHPPSGQRRRNSDTAAELVASADTDRDNRGREAHQMHQTTQQNHRSISRHHHRRRSDSQAPPLLNYKEHFGQVGEPREPLPAQRQSSRASRPIAPWLSEIPQYTTDAEKTEEEQQPAIADDGDSLDEADELDKADEEDHEYDDEGDEGDYDNEQDKAPSIDEYTRSLQMLQPFKQRQEQQEQQQQQQHPNHHNVYLNSNLNGIRGAQNANHFTHAHNYQHHQELPLRTRPLPQSPAPATAPESGFDVPARPANSSMQAAGSWTEPQSPRSVASDYGEFYIPSDTTMQEELEKGPAPKVDPLIMAKVADTYFMRFAFLGGMAVEAWRTIAEAHQAQERYAAQIDRELSGSEALLVWNDIAKTHIDNLSGKLKVAQQMRDERSAANPEEARQLPQSPANPIADKETGIVAAAAEIASNAEDACALGGAEEAGLEAENMSDVDHDEADVGEDEDEAAEEFRLRQEQRDRLMRRAARVYTITTLFNAINHWQAMACEEVSRTKVARRHILRKKVFFAWRDQTASDNAKVTTLALGWFVQRWMSALRQAQNEGDHLAVQFYHRDLVTVKFWSWFRAHQEQTATAWANDRLKRQAIESWLRAGMIASSIKEDADILARHVLLSATGNQWIDQTQTQESILLRIEEQENETYMRAALQDWAKESFCRTQLRAVQSANDTRAKETAFDTWRQSAADSQHRAAQLDLDIAEEYVAHWHRETRLAMFRADYEFDLKTDAVHSWILAEKLAFLMRYRDEQLLRKTCLALKATFGTSDQGQGEQEREDELAQTADGLYKFNIVSAFVSAYHAKAEDSSILQQTAKHIDKATLATKYMCEDWATAAARFAENEEVARRGAFYVGVVNSIDGWSAHARTVREHRLRSTYRSFRRQAKRQAAAECVAIWSSALADVGDEATANDGSGLGGGYDVADELLYEHETHTIFAALNNWILETNDRLFQHSVAAEADTEVYLSRWRLELAGCEELGAAAAEHDTVTQMAGRWDDWELQAVQARAREHTAAALHEKNDRRLGRRVLAVWQQQLVEPELEDLQASYGPRSSVSRWPAEGGVRGSASQYGASQSQWKLDSSISSPIVARSDPPRTGGGGGGGGRSASLLLHPIAESPMATATAQRPLFSRGVTEARHDRTSGGDIGSIGGSYSVPAPGTLAPTVPALYGPSPGAGPLRRLHRSTATAYGRTPQKQEPDDLPRQLQTQREHEQHQEQYQEQQQETPFRSSTFPTSSLATSTTLTPGRDSHRHRLLQRRLQSAARLADSVQLGPMSEFDEFDDMEVTQILDATPDDNHEDPGADNYADVSSEGDDDLDGRRGREGSILPPARRQLLSLSHSTKTPTRFFRSDELPTVSSSSRAQLQSQSQQQQQLKPMFGRPLGNLAQSASNPAAAAPFRRQPDFSLRKAAAAAAAATNSGPAGFNTAGTLAFDPVTTTPMGPLPSPFERRLRAAYGSEGQAVEEGAFFDDDDDDDEVYQEDKRRQRRLAPVSATPLRRIPLQMSTLSMPPSTAPDKSAAGRPGARVTFADTGHRR